MAYHTSGHNGGAGKGGNVVTWNGGMNTASAWKLRKINDQAFIDSLAAAKVQLEIDKQLLALVDQAQEIYDANFVYTSDTGDPMITDANDTGTGQVSSNAKEPSEGSFSALIDKTSAGTPDYSTYFHSQWTAGAPAADHYLQVDISAFQKAKPTSMFNFTWSRRIQNNSNRPTKMTIYATNDTTAGGTWKAIQTIATGWPTKTTDTTYVSNGIVMDQPYKYLRFVVNATNTGAAKNGHVFFSCSNFQIYPVSLDQERSQYITSPGMKEAVDALGALIRSDKEKAANHQSKTSDFDELNAAMNAVKALFADTTEYVALRQKAQDYVNGAVVGTDFGQLSDASLATSLQSLINQQKATLNLAIPKTAEITAAMAALQEKIDAFLAGIKTIEPGKWYYIINAGQKASYAYGQAMMLNGKSTGDATQFGGLVDDNPLYETNPYAMWRFVPIEGSKYYGLQNLGTGHFMGKYRGWGGKLYPEAVTTADPYEVRYMGQGQMAIYSVDSTNTYDCYLNAQRTNSRIVNWPFTANSGTSWTFKEVSATEFSFDVRNKSVQIACFPFDLGDSENTLSSANPSVKTYAVKNLTSDGTNTTVDLTVLEGVIPAGTPFVLEVNDSEADTVTTIVAPAKFDITTSAREANGIVGTLDGIQLSKAGYGYLAGDTLRTTVDTLITIAGGSGYFTPEGLVAGTGETAKQLTAEGLINAIRNISASKGSLRVNVYTVDGKLLRSGVATDEARKGLSKGIYIIGRKKVAVK